VPRNQPIEIDPDGLPFDDRYSPAILTRSGRCAPQRTSAASGSCAPKKRCSPNGDGETVGESRKRTASVSTMLSASEGDRR
jgi:hypothetical protein